MHTQLSSTRCLICIFSRKRKRRGKSNWSSERTENRIFSAEQLKQPPTRVESIFSRESRSIYPEKKHNSSTLIQIIGEKPRSIIAAVEIYSWNFISLFTPESEKKMKIAKPETALLELNMNFQGENWNEKVNQRLQSGREWGKLNFWTYNWAWYESYRWYQIRDHPHTITVGCLSCAS